MPFWLIGASLDSLTCKGKLSHSRGGGGARVTAQADVAWRPGSGGNCGKVEGWEVRWQSPLQGFPGAAEASVALGKGMRGSASFSLAQKHEYRCKVAGWCDLLEGEKGGKRKEGEKGAGSRVAIEMERVLGDWVLGGELDSNGVVACKIRRKSAHFQSALNVSYSPQAASAAKPSWNFNWAFNLT